MFQSFEGLSIGDLYEAIGDEVNLKPRAIENIVKDLRDEGCVTIAKRVKQGKGRVSFFNTTPQFFPNDEHRKKRKQIRRHVTEFLEQVYYLKFDDAIELYLIKLGAVKKILRTVLPETTSRRPAQLQLKKKYLKQLLKEELDIKKLRSKHFVDKRFPIPEGTHLRMIDGKPALVTVGEPNPIPNEPFLRYFYDMPAREMSSALHRHLQPKINNLAALYDKKIREEGQAN